jgi:hypothetical protein
MKYQANPVVVEAHRIVSVGPVRGNDVILPDGTWEKEGSQHLALDNGENVIASAAMRARMEPEPGDYWVKQEDGYIYLNPKDVFERKYSAAREV